MDASDASVESVFETLGNAAEPRPAVAGFTLVDHGKVDVIQKSPLNYVANPGLEQDEKLAWRCDSGQVVRGGGAHAGECFFRIGKSYTRAHWGGSYLDDSEFVRLGVWASGQGSVAFFLCPYAAAKSGQTSRAHLKLPEQYSPDFELSDEWRYFTWEFPVCQLGPYPPRLCGAGVMTRSAKSADFDDAELWRVSLRLPEKFRRR